MFIKAAGALMLLSGSVLIGTSKAQGLSERVKVLMSLEEAVLVFESEIQYRLAPIAEAFEAAGKSDKSGIFDKSIANLKSMGAVQSMKKAIEDCGLEAEEATVMSSFAKGLGACDKQGQVQNSMLCRERLKKLTESARQRRAKLYKLYCISGGVSGIAAVVLLL